MKRAITVSETPYFVKMVIYGDSGVGKTVLAGTAPDLFIVSDENGLLCLKNPKLKEIVNQNARMLPLENFKEMNVIYEFLYNHCILRDRLVKFLNQYAGKARKDVPREAIAKVERLKDLIWSMENGDEPRNGQEPKLYYCVAIDSLTEMQKRSMDRILDIKHGTGMIDNGEPIISSEISEEEAASEEVKPALTTDDDMIITDFMDFEVKSATLPDYGSNTNQMRKLVRAFRDLPMNVIFTALTKDVKNEMTGELFTRPALTEKLSEDVFGYMDIVGYYYTRLVTSEEGEEKLERILQVQPFKNRVAKDRSGMLGNGLRNPTFTRIMNLITGKEQ
jgi:Cdc6-like AAA superfamily ATPase